MSTLTYTHGTLGAPAAETAPSARKSTWRRIIDAISAAQQRRADREIALYLASHGGLFTDNMEREIMRRLSGNSRRAV
ncbi:MAG TPA: hypothetical protein VLL28_05350 [Hyphomicrobiaceae bacterium]|nr:hypothetical protein [Hyphomicrobiaceae bacterium]